MLRFTLTTRLSLRFNVYVNITLQQLKVSCMLCRQRHRPFVFCICEHGLVFRDKHNFPWYTWFRNLLIRNVVFVRSLYLKGKFLFSVSLMTQCVFFFLLNIHKLTLQSKFSLDCFQNDFIEIINRNKKCFKNLIYYFIS